ncbi:peroxidase 2-like [Populus alba x Populus x berolinensis]|nr:peroxidase 2-like [Populus alba x Populus x berolinensis]
MSGLYGRYLLVLDRILREICLSSHDCCRLRRSASSSKLSPNYYDNACPKALPAIKRVVEAAINKERRMGASLLRLHFHDCFVHGCDASLLLDSTSAFDSEKKAGPNKNSTRGFEVIDQIKSEVDKACGRPVVSCADILAVAARDSVVVLGGPTWAVQLGRRDSTTARKTTADKDIPTPVMNLTDLINIFKKHGLDERDLVALSGAHTIGFAQCFTFRDRIYNETNIDPKFARKRRLTCPRTGGNSNLAALDPTHANFDVRYFNKLLKKRGLLHSDQELFNGGSTDSLVEAYSSDAKAFWADFAKSMVKMGNINPLTGKKGQVRLNCRKVN